MEKLVHQIIKQIILWLQIYIYIIWFKIFEKLETSNSCKPPHVHLAHVSATIRKDQALYYRGSISNGQYASDDLWFLDIKNQEEANWLQVPIEGHTPGPRYGHSMIHIIEYEIVVLKIPDIVTSLKIYS